MKREIIVIGAGPAGLACGYNLAKAGYGPITVLEKEKWVGGLARTLEYKEGNLVFRTDIGPHRFLSNSMEAYSQVRALLGNELLDVERKTRQYIEGKYYDYPVKIANAFSNLGPAKSVLMLSDYLASLVRYRILGKQINNFEDYALANFGRRLAELNILNYTEKVWGIPCAKLHHDWARQRIKGLSLLSTLINSLRLGQPGKNPRSFSEHFHYPLFGSGQIYEAYAKGIRKNGSRILTQAKVTRVKHEDKRITNVTYEADGHRRTVPAECVLASMPVTDFVRLLSPALPEEVLEAAGKLRWRDHICVFLTLESERVGYDSWLYFPTLDIPFGRISEMKNFSLEMSPKEKTSLLVEYFSNAGDPVWRMGEKELSELTIRHLMRLGIINKGAVRHSYVIKSTKAYPVYDLTYRENLSKVLDYLEGFSNLECIGRLGRFQYNNQDDSLLSGMMAAERIIERYSGKEK